MRALELRSLWRKLDGLLSAALALERGRIGDEQAAIVQDYLDHNEFGLAYETMVEALSDLDLHPLESSAPLLDEARRLMTPDA